MVTDLTGLFRRLVHDLEQRVDPEKPDAVPDKHRILKTSKSAKDPFEAKAVSIVDSICKLREFLSVNRPAYVDVVLNRDHSVTGLSDLERDRIDNGDFSRTFLSALPTVMSPRFRQGCSLYLPFIIVIYQEWLPYLSQVYVLLRPWSTGSKSLLSLK